MNQQIEDEVPAEQSASQVIQAAVQAAAATAAKAAMVDKVLMVEERAWNMAMELIAKNRRFPVKDDEALALQEKIARHLRARLGIDAPEDEAAN